MLVFMFVIVRVVLSPSLALLFIATTHSSFWLAQIFRSVRRGRTGGLTVEYLVVTTLGRSWFALCESRSLPRHYIWFLSLTNRIDFIGCPKNVLDVEPRCMLVGPSGLFDR